VASGGTVQSYHITKIFNLKTLTWRDGPMQEVSASGSATAQIDGNTFILSGGEFMNVSYWLMFLF